MKRILMIILLVMVACMVSGSVFAQYDAAIVKNVTIDYTNVAKHEMKLRMVVYAVADWAVDVALRGDSGMDYYITYKNGTGNPQISNNYITVYLGSTYYSSSSQAWSQVTAPNTLNETLILASDSFNDASAQLHAVRVSGNAVAVDSIAITDDAGQGFKEEFSYNNLTNSGWQVENSSTGSAVIDTTYANQGAYSIRIQSNSMSSNPNPSGQIYPSTTYPYGTTYNPYGTAYPYGNTAYNPYANPYAQQYNPYANPYAQQYNPYATQQGYSTSTGGAVYGYNPLYQQGSSSPYGYSGTGTTQWYTGQIGQQQAYGSGYPATQGYPQASPYAGPYAYGAGYAGATGAYASPYGGVPYGGIGVPGIASGIIPGVGFPGIGGLGLGAGLGLPGSTFGLGLPGSTFGIGLGMPGFSSFDPIGLALFGGLF